MFDFLKFWKKKMPAEQDILPPEKPPELKQISPAARPEMPGLPSESPSQLSAGLAPEQHAAFRKESPEVRSPLTAPLETPADSGKEFQLINAKLDTIKAGIDHLNARLDKIEKPKEEKEIIAWR